MEAAMRTTGLRILLPVFAFCALAAPPSSLALGEPALAVPDEQITTPLILYTDTVTGPTTGGEKDKGGYLSIFGKNFGTDPNELGRSIRVFIGGVEVANYRFLGNSKVYKKLGIQQITVQVGALAGAQVGIALPIDVRVSGVDSNTDQTFTPSGGRVLFLSLSGNDDTAVANDINHPWRHLQNNSNHKGVYYSVKAGDQIVMRAGDWSDATGFSASGPTWMRFGRNADARSGTAKAWIHLTAYPKPAGKNKIEPVHYTTPPGASGGIQGCESAVAGTTGNFIAISNLQMDVSGGAQRDAAPINFQYSFGPWRIVNNELGPWPAGSSATLNSAGVAGYGDGMQVLGNYIHDIEATSEQQNHGLYAATTAQNWNVAYNWIQNTVGGSLIQFNDNLGGAGTMVLPDGSVWQGFVGIRVHHNWLENSAKYAVNFNDQNSVKKGTYEAQIYDNVIVGSGWQPLRINSTAPVQKLWFAYNTLFDDMRNHQKPGAGYVGLEAFSDKASNKYFNNIFAFGPNTSPSTQWLSNSGALPGGPANNDMKNNLYSQQDLNPLDPITYGDTAAVIGGAKFTDAPHEDFTTGKNSPARNAANQALPSGFVVGNDFTTLVTRPPTGSDIGAYISGQ
jgi:hypothetical protein